VLPVGICRKNKKMTSNKTVSVLLGLMFSGFVFAVAAEAKPLKVYILAGQSNMQGSAHQRTFAAIGDDPQIEVAARELAKLSEKDLNTLLRVIKALRSGGDS